MASSLTRSNENFFLVCFVDLLDELIDTFYQDCEISFKDVGSVSSSSSVTDVHPKIMNNLNGFFWCSFKLLVFTLVYEPQVIAV